MLGPPGVSCSLRDTTDHVNLEDGSWRAGHLMDAASLFLKYISIYYRLNLK